MPFRRWFQSEARICGSIAAITALVRTVGALSNSLIARDGAVFTDRARWILEGRPDRALEVFPQMPILYPTLVAMVGTVTGSLNVAGCVISVVTATATVIPLYMLVREAWNARTAVLACLIYAVLPELVGLGGDVMSESLFLLLFVSSAALTWFTLTKPSWSLAAVNGCCAAMAFQTRSEGIYLVAAALGWTLLRIVRGRDLPEKFTSRALLGAGVFMLAFLVLAAPSLLWVRAKLGHWGVSVNPYALQAMGRPAVFEVGFDWDQPWNPPPPHVDPPRHPLLLQSRSALGAFLDSMNRLLMYVLPPFFLIGWIRWRKEGGQAWGALFLSLLALGYWAPTLLPFFVGGVYTPRYLLPGLVFAFPFVAAGLLWASGKLPERFRGAISAGFLVVIFGIMAVKGMRPHHRDENGIREAGATLRELYGAGKVHIAVMDSRVIHYADGHAIMTPPTIERIERSIQRDKPVSIVLMSTAVGKSVFGTGEPDLERKIEARYPLVRKIVRGDDWIAIYAVK